MTTLTFKYLPNVFYLIPAQKKRKNIQDTPQYERVLYNFHYLTALCLFSVNIIYNICLCGKYAPAAAFKH